MSATVRISFFISTPISKEGIAEGSERLEQAFSIYKEIAAGSQADLLDEQLLGRSRGVIDGQYVRANAEVSLPVCSFLQLARIVAKSKSTVDLQKS